LYLIFYKVKHKVEKLSKKNGKNAPCYHNATTPTVLRAVKEQKQEFLSKLGLLKQRYEWVRKDRPSAIMLAKIISRYACERQIRHLLENGDFRENQRFDPYYRQKSEFATIKILEHIKTKLATNGIPATILTEAPSDIGRHDIVIIRGYPCKVCAKDEEIIRIEIKASLGLNLEQIDRYLWDASPLILARVATGHVAKIEPLTLQSYVLFSLRELNAKVVRLTSDKFYTIPGTACTSCADYSCFYNRGGGKRPVSVVSMNDSEFAEDLNSLFKNLSYVAERTADLVIEELKRVIPS
jgi:hypothetical protein